MHTQLADKIDVSTEKNLIVLIENLIGSTSMIVDDDFIVMYVFVK